MSTRRVTPTLTTSNSISEARNGGDIADVWKGKTDNHVWISIDHEDAFQIGNTTTFVAPTVVAWGNSQFMIFHVGSDNHIYYTWINSLGSQGASQGWVAVPGQTTSQSVSVAQVGAQGFGLYMMYHSLTDNKVWGTFFNPGGGNFPASSSWGSIVNVNGGLTGSSPTVTYDVGTGILYSVVRGLDNQLYLNNTRPGTINWESWQPVGGSTPGQPSIAAAQDDTGNLLLAYRGFDSHIYYDSFTLGGTSTGWHADITGWQTNFPVFLTANGSTIYTIMTGNDNVAYWKQAFVS